MPELNPNMAQKAASAEDSGRVRPNGYYTAKLVKVESTTSRKKDPMWVWYFNVDGKEIRYWTVLKDELLHMLRKVYEAFGAAVGSNTDELVGKSILIELTTRSYTNDDGDVKTVNNLAGFPDQSLSPRVFDKSAGDKDDQRSEAASRPEVTEAPAPVAPEDDQPDF